MMKTILFFVISVAIGLADTHAQPNPDVLLGKWKLDMSPQDSTDDNFAMMEITKVQGNEIKGTFYRKGVKLREGQINTQTDVIYGALVSGDNSGSYNTSFYYKNGKLYGTTHAVDRGFLSVWVAEKEE
ncbi:hypothetical protein [Ekhidna sp.]|uniref:hypothetical protein n=1 Tax=Ekhidna sp. TaxID=2608089 RepID=UPI0032984D37